MRVVSILMAAVVGCLLMSCFGIEEPKSVYTTYRRDLQAKPSTSKNTDTSKGANASVSNNVSFPIPDTVVQVADKYYPPEAYLVEPMIRNGTDFTVVNKSPCGGMPKGSVHMLSIPGSRNLIIWKVNQPSQSGNCTVKLSRVIGCVICAIGADEGQDYITLFPIDGNANSYTGTFPCGRTGNTHERKEFKFPTEFSCDACTLQWIWETEKGRFYQCGDVTLMDSTVEYCTGKCKNGGVCVNGRCVCPPKYKGDFCQIKGVDVTKVAYYWVGFLLIAILIGVLFGLTWWIYKKISERHPISPSKPVTGPAGGAPRLPSRYPLAEEVQEDLPRYNQ